MKTHFTTLLYLLFHALISNAQNTHLQWTSTQISTNAQANEVIAFAVDAQGNNFTINRTQDASSFYISDRFICYNNAGIKKWEIQTDSCFTSCNEKYNCIVPFGNGEVLFIGYRETTANVWELIVKKYKSNGSLGYKKYHIIDYAKPIKAKLDAAGNIIIALDINTPTTGNDFAIVKCNGANGNVLWQSTIPDAGIGGNILYELLSDIVVDNNGNTFGIGMASNTFTNTMNLMVSKWDSVGDIIYSNSIDNSITISSGINAKITADNYGYLYTANNLFLQGIVKKLIDSNAAIVTNKIIKKDSANTQIADFKIQNNQLYILANTNYKVADTSFSGYHETDKLYVIIKTDTNLADRWTKTFLTNFNKSSNDKGFGGAFGIAMCNQQLIINSIQKKNDTDLPYYILHKIDTAGNSLWYDSSKADVGQHCLIGVDASCNAYMNYDAFDGLPTLHSIIKKYSDALNFPQRITAISGANASIIYNANHVQITCADASIFSCKLIGMHGQEIKKYATNNHQILIQKNDLPTGIYIAVLQTNQGAISVKIQL
jgi:hypothetical protein